MSYGWDNAQQLNSISEDEGNCVPYECERNPENSVPSESKISEEGDLCWAEDELSSIESNSRIKKRKRRRSVSYRNQRYKSRSRVTPVSSSDRSSRTRIPKRRKRRKANPEEIPTNSQKSSKTKKCNFQSKISVKNPLKKFSLKFQRKRF